MDTKAPHKNTDRRTIQVNYNESEGLFEFCYFRNGEIEFDKDIDVSRNSALQQQHIDWLTGDSLGTEEVFINPAAIEANRKRMEEILHPKSNNGVEVSGNSDTTSKLSETLGKLGNQHSEPK